MRKPPHNNAEKTAVLPDHLAAIIGGALFAALSWGLYGYNFGANYSHAFYLPGALAQIDPSLYHGDPVIAALRGAPMFFWDFFARLARIFGVYDTAFALWLVSRALAGWVTYRAARALGATMGAAFLSLGMALLCGDLFINSTLAGDPMLKLHLDHSSFSWPLILCAVTLWLEGYRVIAYAALGIVANLNLLIGAITAALLGLADLRKRPRETVAAGALFTLTALPVCIRTLRQGFLADNNLLILCSPLTYLANDWPAERWIKALGEGFLWMGIFRRLPKRDGPARLLASAVGLWIFSSAAAIIPAAHPILSLQLFRLDVVVCWLALAAAGPVLLTRLKSGKPASVATAIAVISNMISPMSGPALPTWSAAALLSEENGALRGAVGSIGLLYGVGALFLSPDNLLWLTPPVALLLAFSGSILVLSSVLPATRKIGPQAAAWVLGLAALFVVWPLAKGAFSRESKIEETRSDLETWANAQPPDTLFIVPPEFLGFRLRSRRPVYAEWTDFNLGAWDSKAASEWKERMAKLGIDWKRFPADYARGVRKWEAALLRRRPADPPELPAWSPSDAPHLATLARRAGARYILAPASAGFPWNAQSVFSGINVYDVKKI